jgi:hypothetical protein
VANCWQDAACSWRPHLHRNRKCGQTTLSWLLEKRFTRKTVLNTQLTKQWVDLRSKNGKTKEMNFLTKKQGMTWGPVYPSIIPLKLYLAVQQL